MSQTITVVLQVDPSVWWWIIRIGYGFAVLGVIALVVIILD